MLSVLSCAGCCYCRFSPFVSISIASHHTFRKRNCSKPRFIHECQALFCSSPMIPFEIHIEINTKTSWRHEEDIYNVDHTQRAKSAPNPAQRAHQSQTHPTQPSAPSTAKSHAQAPTRAKPKPTPNPAERTKQSQIRAQHSTARPARPNPTPKRPPEPNPTPNQPNAPSTAKSHAQPSRARQAEPNPRPTRPTAKSAPNTHSAPTSVSSLFFSEIEPHR